ncbi:MAG: acyl-CoA dehydratase activase-related protein [Mobiluncus porci]|uniref:acyl-CoA dehydratase activase-related protein n=1 Tax=Mobiluncus porci TaxID=2652278 RepID=UPI0023F2AFB8|nr:acyl-CoA dehydratase activase-related protein [Mobiluncus porci]MDD7541361.1 acyl-CoA dehydratase activase-related protein [Mobiluncus porci]MDY5747844.1 acyl-CoA dehydratase activase-related protein [Mobiluncus porci]
MSVSKNQVIRLGVDVGSTTVKAVALNSEGKHVFADYRRHKADVRRELTRLLEDVATDLGDVTVQAAVTGSGGLQVANSMKVPFVQEVIAETEAVRRFNPETDVIIELGGEDAKLTYLHPTPEQRMNGSCAGGTGAFIDQMATLLETDAAGMNTLAEHATTTYPIASRCGVFAKSDIQPLLNQGAAHEDVAASVFTAVATQTIAGLANGRPIRGNVMFLGGPLHFMPQLREAYRQLLPKVEHFTTPDDAQLYVALGSALLADGGEAGANAAAPEKLEVLITRLKQAEVTHESTRMRPLFLNDAEYREFKERHDRDHIDSIPTSEATGRCWLGIDAGSTTIKAVVIDENDRIVFTHYASNEGDPLSAAIEIVRRIRSELPEGTVIGRSCSTGYGEGLVKAGLTLDEGVVETMAHYRAANYLAAGVTSVVDIGGQDMKFIKIKDGTVDSISVNEACSSGCGSFLQTFAATMETTVQDFAAAAVKSPDPIDLGTRCTVFMNSSVKQAQKEGADTGAIAAGLSYSVVRNALYKVIKLKDPSDLGDKVVVQGGTFLNDAVLRAFELLTKREVIRPNIAGLMGAYGAALTAKMHDDSAEASSLASLEELDNFDVETTHKTCSFCQNHCNVSISTFANGTRHVTGNRCERGASLEKHPKKSEIPNLFDWKYQRLFSYRRLTEKNATRGDIGIPRVLGMYEDYPLWFTILTHLGFRVMISGRSSHDLFEEGMESIPSENICYPAKLTHGHIEQLLAKGVKTIFYPCVNYNMPRNPKQDNNFNCPVVATYPEALRHNMESLAEPGVRFISPFLNMADPDFVAKRLVETFADWNVTLEEATAAVYAGYEEDARVKEETREQGRLTLEWMREHGKRGVVLAGRPYHLDPEINHGIPDAIVQLGMAVLTEDSIADGRLERPIRVRDQWTYHSRLYEAAAQVAAEPDLELVQLTSFGCGLDAVTAEQVQEILEGAGDIFTQLKIDEVSNLGAATIRLRSLAAAATEREERSQKGLPPTGVAHPTTTISADGTINVNFLGNSTSTTNKKHPDRELTSATVETYPATAARPDGLQSPTTCTTAAGHLYTPTPFTEKMRDEGYTILIPQMATIQFRIAEPILRHAGYNIRLLETVDAETMETGLKYVNNDACYPSLVVIGQLIDEFVSGRADPNKSAVAMSQTGGMCRATNYASLLRKGLRDAGYPQVPVIAISLQGLEENPGFKFTLPIYHRIIQALVIGDAIQKMLLRVRPYEAAPGSAQALYERWNTLWREWFESGGKHVRGLGRVSYKKLTKMCVREFDELPLRNIARKPRVGIVGEILVKFHPYANNHAVKVIEDEGCEAVLPGLLQFFEYSMADGKWDWENLGMNPKARFTKPFGLWVLRQYNKAVNKAFEATNGKFAPATNIMDMYEKSKDIASMGNQAGEGWYLVSEMVDMIEDGCPNIICVQPFACLPNHIVGKGMFRPLRNRYPQANIVGIDYDPGASAVNQLNRIKLMISTAKINEGRDLDFARLGEDMPDLTETGSASACGVAGGANASPEPVALGMPSLPSRN